MKKINESTKVMLTLKQLRQLVKEASNKIAKDTIYIVKINPEYLKMRVKSWKEVSDDPVYKALAQAFAGIFLLKNTPPHPYPFFIRFHVYFSIIFYPFTTSLLHVLHIF